MAPGRYTELFFLDEATALAAGHRPCFECRRQSAIQFAEYWNVLHGQSERARAAEVDAVLHGERLGEGGEKAVFRAEAGALADGVMIRRRGSMFLVYGGELWRWSAEGYEPYDTIRSSEVVEVLTPFSTVRVIARGYRVNVHEPALR